MQRIICTCGLACAALLSQYAAHAQPFAHDRLQGNLPIQDWKSLKDQGLVKQQYDYSCGASSLATIFQHFYAHPLEEKEILEQMNNDEGMATFADMARVAEHYGYRAQGIATHYDTLINLQIPAVVYLNHRRNDHFSVLRRVTPTHVYLADSSWGNRILTRRQFEQMWHTRDDAHYSGRVLLILPTNPTKKSQINADFRSARQQNPLLDELPKQFWR